MSTHRPSRRQKQAAATRQDILIAARKLFAANGYAATSMAAIAEEAETAIQTLYASVGPKHAIILALVDAMEDDAGVDEFLRRFAQTSEPREMIALIVGLSRQFMERSGDVFAAMAAAAPTEPDVAAAWQKARRNHAYGARHVAERLASLDALDAGVTVERAADILGVLNWGLTWQQFIRDHGWSIDECEAWLTETFCRLLLKPTAR
ncbi:MAG: TetR/AcrR family transcriptional regulator [Thermomicrobiales bacterium]|nr:TetR/AcrR family transcriptional regulator [Thermomicrobiales bacterium]